MPDDAAPTIHQLEADTDVAALVEQLLSAPREGAGDGVRAVVVVKDDGNTAFARVHDAASPGHDSQRWLEHARRGSSPGGWSAATGESVAHAELGTWRAIAAPLLDRLLIDRCKQAWRLEAEAPYVVEFPPVLLDSVLHPARATPTP